MNWYRAQAWAPKAELTAMTMLLGSCIWIWHGTFPGWFIATLIPYLLLCALSHERRKTTQAHLLRNPTFSVSSFVTGCVIVLNIDVHKVVLDVIGAMAWGTIQQAGLLLLYLGATRELVRDRWKQVLIVAGGFAIFHLPNPHLMALTFIWGACAIWLYDRYQSIIFVGGLHGLLSTVISVFLPSMRVGPGYFSWLISQHETEFIKFYMFFIDTLHWVSFFV